MTRLSRAVALAAAFFSACGALAQESSPTSRSLDVARLIALLDSDDFATREQATRDLVGLGPAGREALLQARTGGSLERQMRIEQILQGMGARASSRPARREASRVTLDLSKARLADAVAQIASQAVAGVRLGVERDAEVTVALKDVPFFQALDAVCAQAGCRHQVEPPQKDIVVRPAAEPMPPTAYGGPLRVELVMMMVNRHLRFGAPPSGSANLQVRVDAEERAQALGVVLPLRVAQAVDDRNRDLKPAEPQKAYAYLGRFDPRRQVSAFAPLAVPETDAKAVARIELVLSTLFPTEFYEAEIQAPDAGSEAGSRDFHVSVEQWKEDGDRHLLELVITRPQVPLVAPLQGGATIVDDNVALVGPDGSTIVPDAPQLVPAGTKVRFSASLRAGTTVAAIRVSCLKSYEIVDVPVVITDVPLP